MAFVHVGSAENNGTSGTTVTVTHGQSIGAGDLVVLYLNNNVDSDTPSAVQGAGAVWTEALVETPASETGTQGLWWKVANASEPDDFSVTQTSGEWGLCVKIFTAADTPTVDSIANSDRSAAGTETLVFSAIDGRTISNNAVSIVCGGKDNRSSVEAYTLADRSFLNTVGDRAGQVHAMAHRIYTTDGEVFSGNVILTPADSADGLDDASFSIHISFVEGGGGGAENPWYYYAQQ